MAGSPGAAPLPGKATAGARLATLPTGLPHLAEALLRGLLAPVADRWVH